MRFTLILVPLNLRRVKMTAATLIAEEYKEDNKQITRRWRLRMDSDWLETPSDVFAPLVFYFALLFSSVLEKTVPPIIIRRLSKRLQFNTCHDFPVKYLL